MARFLAVIFASMIASPSFAALATPGSIRDVPEARDSIRRIVSRGFYKSLLISPVKGWVTVRGLLNGTRVINARVVRSDLNGEFDQLALELANNLEVLNYLRSESRIPTTPVLLHVLLYRIADGTLAVAETRNAALPARPVRP